MYHYAIIRLPIINNSETVRREINYYGRKEICLYV